MRGLRVKGCGWKIFFDAFFNEFLQIKIMGLNQSNCDQGKSIGMHVILSLFDLYHFTNLFSF